VYTAAAGIEAEEIEEIGVSRGSSEDTQKKKNQKNNPIDENTTQTTTTGHWAVFFIENEHLQNNRKPYVPAAMTTSWTPDMTAWAAKWMACWEEPHWRSTAVPGTCSGMVSEASTCTSRTGEFGDEKVEGEVKRR
jgi:hypothetical protein